MSGPELHSPGEEGEARMELRQLLNRMLVERINTLLTEAIEASKADPSALQRYRQLQARKLELEALSRAGPKSA
jgi:DNA primase